MLKQTVLAAALAGALLSAVPALAQSTARASADLRIHAGPGRAYPVVDILPAGERVALSRCTRSGTWCRIVNPGGADGWVLAGYLVGMGAKIEASPPTFLVPFLGPQDPNWPGGSTFPFSAQ